VSAEIAVPPVAGVTDAANALIVSTWVADVIAVGAVLAAVMVGLPAVVSSYLKLAVLLPLLIVTLVIVVVPPVSRNVPPPEVVLSVTVRLASAVMALPHESWRCTVIVSDNIPTITVTGEVVNINLFAVPALTVKLRALGFVSVGELASLLAVMLKVPANSS
jgi:hypothetical protein